MYKYCQPFWRSHDVMHVYACTCTCMAFVLRTSRRMVLVSTIVKYKIAVNPQCLVIISLSPIQSSRPL